MTSGSPRRKIGANRYRMPIRFIAHHNDHLFNHLVQVNRLQLRGAFLAQRPDTVDDVSRAPGVLDHFQGSFSRLRQVGFIADRAVECTLRHL